MTVKDVLFVPPGPLLKSKRRRYIQTNRMKDRLSTLFLFFCFVLFLKGDRNHPFDNITVHAFSPLREHSAHKRKNQSNRLLLQLSNTPSTKKLDILVQRQPISEGRIHVLSKYPLVYTIPNLLSVEECQAFRDYVVNLPESRPMTRSNPPEVSLDSSKLWPLGLLSLLAAVPPVYRLFEASWSTDSSSSSSSSEAITVSWIQILLAGLPNIIIASLASTLMAFGVVLPLMRKVSASSSRTSDAVALNQPEDFHLTGTLVDRVVAYTTHPWDHWEAPVVTRYDVGAVFTRHGDASPTKGSEWDGFGGQRVVTCICYLKTLSGDGGGETYFDKLGLAVTPVAGTALVFFPADDESWIADDRTTHESLPPQEEKWIVQMFGRAQEVPHPLGLPHCYQNMI